MSSHEGQGPECSSSGYSTALFTYSVVHGVFWRRSWALQHSRRHSATVALLAVLAHRFGCGIDVQHMAQLGDNVLQLLVCWVASLSHSNLSGNKLAISALRLAGEVEGGGGMQW